MFATGLLWLLLAPGFLQEPLRFQEPTGQSGAMENTEPDPDYRLGPADVLSVRVLGLREFTQETLPWLDATVSNSGRVHLPHVGIVNVTGMTTAQLESEIARRLRDQDLVKDPQVTVGVQAYRSNTVYILGEVAQPGQYYMREEMRVMDLIGLSMSVPTEGMMYLYRRTPDQAGGTALAPAVPIDIQQLAEGKRPELNLKLQGGDILYVPFNRPNYFFVTGDVLNPGSFEMPPRRQLLISEAISFAGGPTRTAKTSQGILVRYDEQGGRQELALDFNAILEGEKPDFPVMPNDVVFIPGSHAKSLARGFLSLIPSIAFLAIP